MQLVRLHSPDPYALDKRNDKTQREKEKLNPLFKEILLHLKLGEDTDKSGTLEAGELAGLTLSQEKRKELSCVVAKHESEWEDSTRYEPLIKYLNEIKNKDRATMIKDRIEKLSFFDDVMALDFSPTFFHPVGLVGAMNSDCQPKELPKLFDFEDAKAGIKKVYDTYGEDMAIIIEKMFRSETSHFSSKQYIRCGTGGMEATKRGKAPYYGWKSSRYVTLPIGTWSHFEGKGVSTKGANKQDKKNKKRFIIFDSVLNAMMYKVNYIEDNNGDHLNWFNRTDEIARADYQVLLDSVTPRIVRHIKEGTSLSILENLPNKVKEYQEHYLELVEELKLEVDDGCGEKIEEVEESIDDICFPLAFIPKESYITGARKFGSNRSKGRKHAGCDLYAPIGTKIYAMADGEIIAHREFYLNTNQIIVKHKNFIARYGEVRPNGKGIVSDLKVGSKVKKGQHIGYVGKLVFESGTVMHMLHLELYTSAISGSTLTVKANKPYQRRSDLINPTEILNKAKNNLPN